MVNKKDLEKKVIEQELVINDLQTALDKLRSKVTWQEEKIKKSKEFTNSIFFNLYLIIKRMGNTKLGKLIRKVLK